MNEMNGERADEREKKLKAELVAIQRAREIHCPYCDRLWVDEECDCVSTSGDEPDVEVQCHNECCEKFFMVKEIVVRTFETSYMGQPVPWSELSDKEFDLHR